MTLRQFLSKLENEVSIIVVNGSDAATPTVANFMSSTYESIVDEYLDMAVSKIDISTNATGLKSITVTVTE